MLMNRNKESGEEGVGGEASPVTHLYAGPQSCVGGGGRTNGFNMSKSKAIKMLSVRCYLF